MHKIPIPILMILSMALLLIACTGAPSPGAATATPPAKQETTAALAPWEQRWNGVVTEARKEGSVAIYSLWRPETRTAVTAAFKDKYGIGVEFTPFGRGAELVAKVQAEQRAGLYYVDTFGAGNPLLQTSMKPENLLGPLRPILILPEVTDPKAWRAGAIPFSDDEGTAVSLIGVTIRTIAYNVDLIREGELTSYEDLLKPQYKGKITLNDPTVTGPGNAAISHLGHSLWGEDKTVDFLRRLLRDQQAIVQRDNRVHMESVARGKYAIAVAPLPDLVAEFYELKAPVRAATVKEDNRLTAAAGALAVPTKFAHPNAATVLVNWLLTREGQSIFSRSWGNPATRVDVSTEGINPLFVPVPGEKYVVESAEAMNARARWLQLAKKIIDETSR